MRAITLMVIGVIVIAGCGGESSATPVPPSATPAPELTPTPTPIPTTPTPVATFDPGPVILPTVPLPTITPTPSAEVSLSNAMDGVALRATTLRNLSQTGPIERALVTREQAMAHLSKELAEDRDEVEVDEELYVTLGLLSGESSYYDLLLSVSTEVLLGFYDAEEEKIFVVAEGKSQLDPRDQITFAHGQVHALQQQHFNTHSIRERLKGNSDMSRAFRALTEGDASVVETLYTVSHLDREEQAQLQEDIQAQSAGLQAFNSAPQVVQRLITFPYIIGPRFVVSLFLTTNSWRPVDQAYGNLPRSTEQILHPQKYMSGEEPVIVELPDIAGALGEGWVLTRRDTMGEFFLFAYLETGTDPERAQSAATGWGGDSYSLLKGPDDENLLVSLIAWDDQDEAREFFDTILEVVRVRTEAEWQQTGVDETSFVMDLPDQDIYVRLDAEGTLLIFAPDAQTLETARAAVQGG